MLEAPDSTPFVWTAGRGALKRLVAHVLIRLLILSPLPPQLQLGAALFPLSLLWPLVARAELVPEPQEKAAEPGTGRGCVLPLSEAATGVSGLGAEPGACDRLISLNDPTNPQIVGTLEGVGARLQLSDSGVLFSTSGSYIVNPNDPFRGLHATTLGPTIPIVTVNPKYVLLDEFNKSVDDVTIKYRIAGFTSDVTSARIELVDETDAVLYSTSVSPSEPGEVVWPKGQILVPTPNSVSFEVRNPDGTVTEAVSGEMAGLRQEPPVISSLSPARVTVGSGLFELTVRGRNFGLLIGAKVALGDGAPASVPVRYVSPTEVRVTVPSSFAAQVRDLLVTVSVAQVVSEPAGMRVVPTGLPPAPVLTSIEPTSVTAQSDYLWLTLRGSRFDAMDSVIRVDRSGDPLSREFVSANEVRALVPADLLLEPGSISFRVESTTDPDLVSDALPLEVLGTSVRPIVPIIDTVMPRTIPFLPESGPSEPIVIGGQGFQSGAQVFARIDGGDPIALATTLVSPEQITATPPTQLKHHRVSARLVATTQAGSQVASKTSPVVTPSITFRSPVNGADQVWMGFFFDPNSPRGQPAKYFVDTTTGVALSKAFERERNRFYVDVVDPSQTQASNVKVELQSDVAGGGLDPIPSVDMKGGAKPGTFSSGPLVAVVDPYDDGATVAEGGVRFSSNDQNGNDPTIQGIIGGTLWAAYRNSDKLIKKEHQTTVCPQSLRRKIRLRIYNVAGSGVSTQDITDTIIPEAKEIWAQACTDLVVQSAVNIPDPNQLFATLDYIQRSAPNQYSQPRWVLSQSMRQLIGNRTAFGDYALDLFFIKHFVDPASPTQARVEDAAGLAITGTGYVKTFTQYESQLVPEGPFFTGVNFICADNFADGIPVNGRTVAHELAHVVVGVLSQAHPDGHLDEAPNILRSGRVRSNNLLKKRLNLDQVILLWSSPYAQH